MSSIKIYLIRLGKVGSVKMLSIWACGSEFEPPVLLQDGDRAPGLASLVDAAGKQRVQCQNVVEGGDQVGLGCFLTSPCGQLHSHTHNSMHIYHTYSMKFYIHIYMCVCVLHFYKNSSPEMRIVCCKTLTPKTKMCANISLPCIKHSFNFPETVPTYLQLVTS